MVKRYNNILHDFDTNNPEKCFNLRNIYIFNTLLSQLYGLLLSLRQSNFKNKACDEIRVNDKKRGLLIPLTNFCKHART